MFSFSHRNTTYFAFAYFTFSSTMLFVLLYRCRLLFFRCSCLCFALFLSLSFSLSACVSFVQFLVLFRFHRYNSFFFILIYLVQLVYLFLFCFFTPSICSLTHSVFRLLIFVHVSRVFKQNCWSTFENRICSNVCGLFFLHSLFYFISSSVSISFSVLWSLNGFDIIYILDLIFFWKHDKCEWYQWFLFSLFISTASSLYRDTKKWK